MVNKRSITRRSFRVRGPAANPVNEKVYLKFTDSYLDQLTRGVWKALGHADETSLWCSLVFLLIVSAGISGDGALGELLRLQFRDLITAKDGYISIWRYRGRYPVFVRDDIALFVCGLILNKAKGASGRYGKLDLKSYIVPGVGSGKLSDEVSKRAQQEFASWLTDLSSRTGKRITVGQLIGLARARIFRVYPPAVAAALVGEHYHHPIPVSDTQVADNELIGFRELNGIGWKSRRKDPAEKILEEIRLAHFPDQSAQPQPTTPQARPKPIASLDGLEKAFSPREFAHLPADAPLLEREKYKASITKYINGLERGLQLRPVQSWQSLMENCLDKPMMLAKLQTVFVGRWLLARIDVDDPKFVAIDYQRIQRVAYHFSPRLLFSLSFSDFWRYFDSQNWSPELRFSYAMALKRFFDFSQGDLTVPAVNWFAFQVRVPIHDQHVLTLPEIERAFGLLTKLVAYRSAGIALLLGYYFGLREIDMRQLRIGNVILSSERQTLYIFRSKFGKDRIVRGIEIPENVVSILQKHHERRLLETEGNMNAPYLVNTNKKPFGKQVLSKKIKTAFDELGIDISMELKDSAAHLLRHACANRWLRLGLSLVDIAHLLGHNSVDTTINSYTHVFPLLQLDYRDNLPMVLPRKINQLMRSRLRGVVPRHMRDIEKGWDQEHIGTLSGAMELLLTEIKKINVENS